MCKLWSNSTEWNNKLRKKKKQKEEWVWNITKKLGKWGGDHRTQRLHYKVIWSSVADGEEDQYNICCLIYKRTTAERRAMESLMTICLPALSCSTLIKAVKMVIQYRPLWHQEARGTSLFSCAVTMMHIRTVSLSRPHFLLLAWMFEYTILL